MVNKIRKLFAMSVTCVRRSTGRQMAFRVFGRVTYVWHMWVGALGVDSAKGVAPWPCAHIRDTRNRPAYVYAKALDGVLVGYEIAIFRKNPSLWQAFASLLYCLDGADATTHNIYIFSLILILDRVVRNTV